MWGSKMYYAEVNWYNVMDETDIVEHIIICTDSWNDAVQEIINTYEYVNSINIRQINSDGNKIVAVPEESVDKIIDLNSY